MREQSAKYPTLNRMLTAVLVIVCLCLTSCAAESETSAAASRFEGEIREEEYKEVDSPSEAPVFRWDFSENKTVHFYRYQQEVRNESDMGALSGGSSGVMDQEMSANGDLLIKSQGDGTAELVLKDMKMTMKMDMGEDEPKTMEQVIPALVVQGVKEDGSGSFGDSSQDLLLKMLFPLPPQSLKVGESVDVPAEMPFNAMGSMLKVTGRSRITLDRYVRIDGRTCAKLDVDTDISRLNVPSELKGEYKCSTKGSSVFYFDVENRSFVSGTIALIMQFSIDAPTPRMKISGEDAADMPERSKVSMVSDNLIKVRLKE